MSRAAALEAAIDRLNCLLATAPEDSLGDRVAERRVMRLDLHALREEIERQR